MTLQRPDSRKPGFTIQDLFKRLMALEDQAKRRMLPPGYEFSVVNGSLIVRRLSDDVEVIIG